MRHTRGLSGALIASIAALSLSPGALAGPPSDEAIERIIETYQTERAEISESATSPQEYREKMAELSERVLEGVDLAECRPTQLAWFVRYRLVNEGGARETVLERAGEFADDRGAEGAAAAYIEFNMKALPSMGDSPDPDVQQRLLRNLLTHPGLDDAVRRGAISPFIIDLSRMGNPEALKKNKDLVLGLRRFFEPGWPSRVALGAEGYFEIVKQLGLGEELVQEIRAECAAAAERTLDNPEGLEKTHVSWLEKQHERLTSASARGELLGHKAPTLTFDWSAPERITSLGDLDGRVVVLDFWATWCGPCVASFPKLRELQARYDGYPVEIIGVTSLQGTHYAEDGPVDTSDDPQKEYRLMGEYIDEKDITWTIAFSEQEVFNPDYGVRGIPHVAIIDPAGVVRYNGLHPSMPLEEKAARIDALLAEFDLPTPPPVGEKPGG